MNIDNIVIPGGILATWDGPQSTDSQRYGGADESFDVVEVAKERARSLSLSFDSQGGRRGSTLERIASTISSSETERAVSAQEPCITYRQRPGFQRQRSNTINLGGLARSRATGLSTPANPGLRLEPAATFRDPLDSINSISLEDSYVFQRLEDCKSSNLDTAWLPSTGPLFLSKSSSVSTATPRRESSQTDLERNPSKKSLLSSAIGARRASIAVGAVVDKVKDTVTRPLRRSSLHEVYEKSKIRQVQLKRSPVTQISFQYISYLLMLAGIYFIFVGFPLWQGLVLVLINLFRMQSAIPAGTAVFLGIAFLYAYLPLLLSLEKEPSQQDSLRRTENGQANDTALLIPCYKSEKLIGATLEAALKIFPARNIFVIANGNSPTPLDNTAGVCDQYGVSHTWSPVGSKIIAQFVGCFVAKRFPYVLLIDDDCLLPPNFPVVTERIRGRTMCIGYTIKSVGPNSTKGTLCQQAQDMEYKLSGLQRAFAGRVGSATFPHGAISIWDRKLLIKTFQAHPGFSVSEDWFFGHVARQLGCRIQMCTAVFVETETPSSIFFSSGGARGGFGEMTIWKQRFFRWNYFFVSGVFWDMSYIIRRWNLGWWELGAKLFVFQEVYETLLYLLAPFVIPISFFVRPLFTGYLFLATLVLYQINVFVFNYIHLRARNESVSFLCLIYYLFYKIILTFVNIASCYYSIYKYAKYFAKRHPKVIEDEKALAVVLRLEEESYSDVGKATSIHGRTSVDSISSPARRFTVTAVGTNLSSALAQDHQQGDNTTSIDVVDFAARPEPRPNGHISNQSRRKTHRMPLATSPPRRPFSWHRSASDTSSESGISPFDERKEPHFRLKSREATPFDQPLEEVDQAPNKVTSPPPAQRSFSTDSPSGGLSHQSLPLQRSFRAPRLSASNITSSQHQILGQHSRSGTSMAFHLPTTTIKSPPPAKLREPYRFASLSSVEETIRRGPSRGTEPDMDRYISALADTDSTRHGSRDRLFIREEDEGEEEIGASRQLDPIRRPAPEE